MAPMTPCASSSRRRLLQIVGMAGLGLATSRVRAAETSVRFSPLLPGGPDERPLTTAFPQKGPMVLQRSRPPLLETPFEVFDRGIFTPNNQFFVRWHWAAIPEGVDVAVFKLAIHGHVNNALTLSMADVLD